jgi:hypothetical protein
MFFIFALKFAELLKFEAHSSGYDFAKYQPPEGSSSFKYQTPQNRFLGGYLMGNPIHRQNVDIKNADGKKR